MKLSASPFVVRVWIPTLFILGVCLFFHDTAPEYWLIALPLVVIVTFMTTLAEIQDEGHQVHVKMLWHSIYLPKEQVRSIAPSFVDGVSVLRLRRFMLPWGRIYFVSDWSKFGVMHPRFTEENTGHQSKHYSSVRSMIEWLVAAISGFLAGQTLRSRVHLIRIGSSALQMGALLFAATLFALFLITRRNRPNFANVLLFLFTFVVVIVFGMLISS